MSATRGVWRVGRKVGRTIYADEALIGVMDRREDAAAVVAAQNELRDLESAQIEAMLLREALRNISLARCVYGSTEHCFEPACHACFARNILAKIEGGK